jgi:hypothetical protein
MESANPRGGYISPRSGIISWPIATGLLEGRRRSGRCERWLSRLAAVYACCDESSLPARLRPLLESVVQELTARSGPWKTI